MNTHETRAWQSLIEMGALQIELGGKPGLDIRSIRLTSGGKIARFADAFLQVAGRSGAVRRHVDRQGRAVFVIADQAPAVSPPAPPASSGIGMREGEELAAEFYGSPPASSGEEV